MSVANKVSPTAASITPTTGRVGGRGLASGTNIVDDITSSPWLGNSDNAQRFGTATPDSGFGNNQNNRRGQRDDMWTPTPLVTRGASSFQATQAEQETSGDNQSSSYGGSSFKSFLKLDVVRGVGVYNHNLSVVSSVLTKPGSVVNRAY